MTATLLAVLGVLLLALWFFDTHERVSREKWIGFQGEARGNNFLAAQMLLEELGIDVESTTSLTPTEWMPPAEDTLVVRMSPTLAIGLERVALEQWVLEGGHLMLLPPRQEAAETDEFLASLGFRLEVSESSDADEPPEEARELQEGEHDLENHHSNRQIMLTDDSVEMLVIRKGSEIVVARRQWGDGYITLAASYDAFGNRDLEHRGNARLFADIVAGQLEPGVVWLIYQSNFTPLWAIILRAAPYLVLGLALLLALWMWHVMPVFGPRIRAQEESRRSIIEHVKASGLFIWRHQGGDSLVTNSAKALVHDGESLHPGLSRHSPQRQAEIIARITGMPAQKVMDALGDPGELRQREFTHSMQKLQTIRKEL